MCKYYCLNCHQDIREEGSLQEMFYVDDVLCCSCRQRLEYHPKKFKIDNLKVTSLYIYDGFVRELIIQYKEYKDEALFPLFLYPYVNEIKRKYKDYVLVPIPSSEASFKQRGFNQVVEMFSLLSLPVCDILRKDNDISQKDLNYNQRQDILNHMVLTDDETIRNRKVLLVDDIVTSGSSLRAAYRLIEHKCQKCEAITVAYNKKYLNKIEENAYNLVVNMFTK